MRRLVAAIGLVMMGCAPGDQVTSSPRPSAVATTAAEALNAAAAPRLVGAGMAFDTARGHLVVFGTWYWPTEFPTGLTQPASPTAETWTWKSGKWTKLAPVTSPPPRAWAGMAYDEARRQVVLFGGGGRGSSPLNDTWIWDGKTWSGRTPVESPPATGGPALVYDAKLGRVVALVAVPNDVTQTWTWDGSTWARLHPSIELPSHEGSFAEAAPAAYDATRGSIVVFGRSLCAQCADTWTFDGNTWARHIAGPGTPPGRNAATLAYDPSSGKVLLFGGASSGSDGTGGLADSWMWDGSAWTQANPAARPHGRVYARTASDTSTGQVILYGGAGFGAFPLSYFDVWTWAHGAWTRVQPTTIAAPPDERESLLQAASGGPSLPSNCSAPCMSVRGLPQIGFYAGYVVFDLTPPQGSNELCISYVSYVSKAGEMVIATGPWHQVGVACGPIDGHLPQLGVRAQVSVTGCANLRTFPQGGAVISCLPKGTAVTIDD